MPTGEAGSTDAPRLLTERTIPILPCRSIDDVLAFYVALGFEITYRQERPNTFAIVARGGIELQFFVLKELDPTNSYSTCYVLVPDADALHEAFTSGLRAATGRVPSRGIPRIGPVRDTNYGVRQFIVVDPGGNYIRIGQPIDVTPPDTSEHGGRLERALVAAVRLADSKDDAPTAARTLDSALAAADAPNADPSPVPVRFRALVLRADLCVRLGDPASARRWLSMARDLPLSQEDRRAARDEVRRADDLFQELATLD